MNLDEILKSIPKKRKRPKGHTVVYSITINGIIRYIGITNNINRRAKEHNKGIDNLGDRKPFYQWCRQNEVDSVDLETMYEYSTRIEARRRECLLILIDHFDQKLLLNKVPSISDR